MVKQDGELAKSFHELMSARAQTLTGTPPPQTPLQSGPRRRTFSQSTRGASEQLKQASVVYAAEDEETLNVSSAIQNHAAGVRHP